MKTDEKAYEDLLAERNELNVRISRLDHFCRNVHNISRLSLHQKALMGVQLQAMKTYREVLTARATDIQLYGSDGSKQ